MRDSIILYCLHHSLQVVSTKVGGIPEVLPPEMIHLAMPNVKGRIRLLYPHLFYYIVLILSDPICTGQSNRIICQRDIYVSLGKPFLYPPDVQLGKYCGKNSSSL